MSDPRRHAILHAPIPTMVLTLAAPNVLATIMNTLTTFFDAWVVGQLGTEALASLALVYPFLALMFMMAGGAIGGGVTSAISRALGAGATAHAEAVAWHAVLISLGMAALFAITLGVFAEPVFALMGGEGAALDGAVTYARITFGGGVALWLMWVMAAVVRGTGDTETPARAILVSSVAQIGLAGGLTLGWGPLPQLGIAGPATALILCQGLAGLYLIWHLRAGRAAIGLPRVRAAFAPFTDIMRVGGIGLINSITIATTIIVVTGYVGQYGTEALAGYGLGSRLELMLVPLTFGVGAALTVAVGTNFGAQNHARARNIAWFGASSVALVLGLLGIAIAAWPALWLNLFTADEAAYAIGARYLNVVGPAYGLFAFGQALYFASQGTGKPLLPVLVGVVRLFSVAGIGACVIVFGGPLWGIFAGVSVGMTVIGVGLALCLRSRAWAPDRYGGA